jgi:hypothetical protein
MHRDFEIADSIYFVQPPHTLDLHNHIDFVALRYSISDRLLFLEWRRSDAKWVPHGTPSRLSIEFRQATQFRFAPRNAELPFTEDACVSAFGYWTDEPWANGEIIASSSEPDPRWLVGIRFMSGATIAVRALSAHATITE